jgi:single-strand DNA-binding protein
MYSLYDGHPSSWFLRSNDCGPTTNGGIMAQQGIITITGFVGANPIGFGREGKTGGCSFRVGSTRSYFHAASGEWKDQPTTWMTVKAFRTLALNVLASVRKGDPVIVSGLLNTEEWQQDGNNRSRIVIEASAVGHDLSRGVGSFQRQNSQRGQPGQLSGQTASQQGQNAHQRSSDDQMNAAGYDRPPANGSYALAHSSQTVGGDAGIAGQPSDESMENGGNPGGGGFTNNGVGEDPWSVVEKQTPQRETQHDGAAVELGFGVAEVSAGDDGGQKHDSENAKAGEPRNAEGFAGPEF